jgi:hypothetical protein
MDMWHQRYQNRGDESRPCWHWYGSVLWSWRGHRYPVTVTDWRPFDYISYQIETPLHLKVDQTIEMQPIENGTHMIVRYAKPSINGLIERWKSRGKIDTLTGLFRGLYS